MMARLLKKKANRVKVTFRRRKENQPTQWGQTLFEVDFEFYLFVSRVGWVPGLALVSLCLTNVSVFAEDPQSGESPLHH